MADKKYNGIWLSPIMVDLLSLIHRNPRLTDEEIINHLDLLGQGELKSIIRSVEGVFETNLLHASYRAKSVGIIP